MQHKKYFIRLLFCGTKIKNSMQSGEPQIACHFRGLTKEVNLSEISTYIKENYQLLNDLYYMMSTQY